MTTPARNLIAGAWRDDTPGPLRETGNLFDVAIAGRGWFRVETPAGERLTRAGDALGRCARACLVHAGSLRRAVAQPVTLRGGDRRSAPRRQPGEST